MVQESGKRVELFKELMPDLRRLITVRRPGDRPSEESMREIRDDARDLKIDLLDLSINSREELRTVLAKTLWHSGDGIMVVSDTFVISNIDLVLETSLERHIPAFGTQDYMADWGALRPTGPVPPSRARMTPSMLVDLAIEPIDPAFVVNLKAAQCLGVSLSPEVLHHADRIVR